MTAKARIFSIIAGVAAVFVIIANYGGLILNSGNVSLMLAVTTLIWLAIAVFLFIGKCKLGTAIAITACAAWSIVSNAVNVITIMQAGGGSSVNMVFTNLVSSTDTVALAVIAWLSFADVKVVRKLAFIPFVLCALSFVGSVAQYIPLIRMSVLPAKLLISTGVSSVESLIFYFFAFLYYRNSVTPAENTLPV